MAEAATVDAAAEPELPPPAVRGRLTVSERVVVNVARLATREVGGTVVTGSRALGHGLPRVRADVAGGRTRVSVQVAVAWPYRLPVIAEQIRDAVAARVHELTGLIVDGVEVVVAAVIPPHDIETERQIT